MSRCLRAYAHLKYSLNFANAIAFFVIIVYNNRRWA